MMMSHHVYPEATGTVVVFQSMSERQEEGQDAKENAQQLQVLPNYSFHPSLYIISHRPSTLSSSSIAFVTASDLDPQ